jgi:hypothetical protein
MPDIAPARRVHDVLHDIAHGHYRIPNIQRGYEWDEQRIAKLLDSIMSGYPLGAIMVWKPAPDVAHDIPTRAFIKHFDTTSGYTSDPTGPVGEEAYLVLDGQQRLQSLYLSFFGTYNGRSVYLQIDHVPTDVDEDTDYRFEFLTTDQSKSRPEMVSLSRILQLDADTRYDFVREKAKEIVALAAASGDTAVTLATKERLIAQNVDRFIDRFDIRRELLFQEVGSKLKYDHVLEIFERVNSGGMVLDKSDLLFSTLKLKLARMEDAFAETLKFLAHGARYEFSNDFLIKTCLVVFDQRAKYEVSKLKDDAFVKNVAAGYKQIDYCLRHLSTWLDDTARIKCSRFLRSRLALIPLIDWMMQSGNRDKPDGENGRAMAEYLYMSFFRRLYRAPDPALDQLHALIRDSVAEDRSRFPIERIRAFMSQRQATSWTLHDRYFEDDVDLCLNIVDGGQIQIDPSDPSRHPKDLKLEVDHIFPRAPLTAGGMGDAVNHVGNYRLVVMPINRRKLARMPDEQTAFFGRGRERVEDSYLACLSATKAGSFDRASFMAFREARAKLIRETVSAFLRVPLAS